MRKHWRTSLAGAICILFGIHGLWDNLSNHYYNVNNLEMVWQSLHYWRDPFVALVVGIGLLHAADHKNLPPDKP